MTQRDQALQITLSEMFFTPNLVLVEGLEDYAYITSYLSLLDLWDEYRRLGVHIVPTDGKSGMIQALAIAKTLKIPTFVLFDSDGDKPDRNGSKVRHEKDNTAILKLCGYDTSDPFPKDTFWGIRVVMWNSDIGTVIETDIGKTEWKDYQDRADRMYGQAGNLHKNTYDQVNLFLIFFLIPSHKQFLS
jgi:hypothetical protein